MTEYQPAHGKVVNELFFSALLVCMTFSLPAANKLLLPQPRSFLVFIILIFSLNTLGQSEQVAMWGWVPWLGLNDGSFPKSPSFRFQKPLVLKDYASMLNNILKFTSLYNHPYLPKIPCAVAVVQRPITPMRQILHCLPSDKQKRIEKLFWFYLVCIIFKFKVQLNLPPQINRTDYKAWKEN